MEPEILADLEPGQSQLVLVTQDESCFSSLDGVVSFDVIKIAVKFAKKATAEVS